MALHSAGAFALMVLISGISLIVGAIVIANIMFVSVVAFVAVGLLTGTLTGLLAGPAPAASAARLTPVEALRHE